MECVQWRSEGAEGADHPGRQSGGAGKKDGKWGWWGDISRHLTTFGNGKMQCAAGCDNRHCTPYTGCVIGVCIRIISKLANATPPDSQCLSVCLWVSLSVSLCSSACVSLWKEYWWTVRRLASSVCCRLGQWFNGSGVFNAQCLDANLLPRMSCIPITSIT